MATFKNDPFPGTDYSQYQSWEKVTAPNGTYYYVVPGNPGYVYDPILSNSTGKKVFRPNPSDSIKKQQDEQSRLEKAQKQDAQNKSPVGQLVPVAAGTAGTIAAYKYGIKGDPLFGKAEAPPATFVRTEGPNIRYSDGSLKTPTGQVLQPGTSGASNAPQTGSAPAPTTQGQAAAQGATQGPNVGPVPDGNYYGNSLGQPAPQPGALGPVPNGDAYGANLGKPVVEAGPTTMQDGSPGTAMQDGGKVGENGIIETPQGDVVKPAPGTAFRVVQGVGGAAQVYNGYQQWNKGQKISGAANVIGGTYNMYAAYQGGATSEGAGQVVAPLVAAANIGQNIVSEEGNTQDRAANSKTEALKSALVFIPGYGEVAYAALAAGDAVTGGKFTQTWSKANKKLDEFNRHVDFGLQHAVDKKLFHQSTRGVAQEHSGQLAQFGTDDKVYQDYLGAVRTQYNEAPPDPSKPFAGKYKTWDEYKKAGLESSDLTGVYGNLRLYGPEWAHLTEEQRRAVTQANIDSGIYDSHKGEVQISDDKKGKENFDNVMKGFQAGVQTVANPAVPVVAPGVQPAKPTQAQAAASGALTPQTDFVRTTSRTPGIDLNGRRIVY